MQIYRRVHISSDEVFYKILKKPSIVLKWMILMLFYPTHLRNNPWNFREKYWELGELENDILFSFLVFCWGFQKKQHIFVFPPWKSPWLSYEVSFISANGWFLQSFEKGFIRNDMHTTVQCTYIMQSSH